MKIFVTGYCGFIGEHLSKRLNEMGIEWDGYDLQDGDDIRDKVKLDVALDKSQADVVIHLAALTGVRRGEDYAQEYFDTNAVGTENLLQLSKKFGVKKFIALSSSSVNGGEPNSIYGASKLAMEHLVKRCDLPYQFIVRPFTVYGEQGRKDEVLPRWIEQYKQGKPITFYGDGMRSFRTYVYVGDLIDAILMMLTYEPQEKTITFELGGGEKVYLSKVLTIFLHKYPDAKVNYLPLPPGDSLGREPSAVEVEKMGWKPKTDYETKMMEII